MSSVIGETTCPQCGGIMRYEFNCRTGEEIRQCICCGHSQSWLLLRDETGAVKCDESGQCLGDYSETPGYGTAYIVRKDGLGERYHFDHPISDDEITAFIQEIQDNADPSQSYILTYSLDSGTLIPVLGMIPSGCM